MGSCVTSWEELFRLVTTEPSPPRQRPDEVLNTLRYLYVHARCGVFVRIRARAVTAFVPFANPEYRNTFGDRIALTHHDMAVAEYVEYKARATRRPPEAVLPDKRTWWLNGGIVCNVMPRGVWGVEYLDSIRAMLEYTCAVADVPDLDFFVNKRDYPQLRRDHAADVYEAFTGVRGLPREVYTYHAPIFSFYTGTDMADVAVPVTEDWLHASGEVLTPTYTGPQGAGDTRDARAVFRGSATGRGTTPATNARLRVAAFGAARPDLLDAGVTAYNTRDKVIGVTATGRIVVDFARGASADVPALVPRMDMGTQFQRYRYVLYVDGHCAASRYGVLMHSGCVILRVASEHDATCGRLWLFDACVGVRVGEGAAVAVAGAGADHCVIDADLSNLEATITYLRAHPDAAASMVTAARTRAPTVASIAAAWAKALACTPVDPCPGTGTSEWYPARDKRYARIGRPQGMAAPGMQSSSADRP
jgi:hypothetical protein